jgi:hypothetical protein
MTKHLVILRTAFAVLFLGVVTPQFAQNTFTNSQSPDRERRAHAIALLRAIGTVEVGELSNYGSYSSWQTLLAHQPKYFDKFLAINYPQEGHRTSDLVMLGGQNGEEQQAHADCSNNWRSNGES